MLFFSNMMCGLCSFNVMALQYCKTSLVRMKSTRWSKNVQIWWTEWTARVIIQYSQQYQMWSLLLALLHFPSLLLLLVIFVIYFIRVLVDLFDIIACCYFQSWEIVIPFCRLHLGNILVVTTKPYVLFYTFSFSTK